MELATLAFADYDHPDPNAAQEHQHATKRRKINLACEQCRSRKARCDGAKPICGNCTRRKEQCLYKVTKAQADITQDYVESLLTRIAALEEENARLKDSKEKDQSDAVAKLLSNTSHESPVTVASPTAQSSRRAVNKKFSNIDGTGAGFRTSSDSYFGYSSTSALMDEVMNALGEDSNAASRMQMASVPSIPIGIDNATFEADYAGPENFSLFPRPVTDFLLDRYWDKIYPMYPFIHKPTFMQSYERLWNSAAKSAPENPALGLGESGSAGPLSFPFHIALNAMLVLGLQFTDLDARKKDDLTFQCIQKAKNLLKVDLFNEGGLAVLQMTLLLGHFFQSTSSPNKAWNIIGISCRIAQAMGLHMDGQPSNSMPPLERELRRRTWYATLIFDMILAMTLGRPVALRRRHGVPLPEPTDDEYLIHNIAQPDNHVSDLLYFHEISKLHMIMREALATIYKEKPSTELRKFDQTVDLDSAVMRLEKALPHAMDWNRSLPEDVRMNRAYVEQQRNVLQLRFFAARMGLHRPLLLDYCHAMQQTRGLAAPGDAKLLSVQCQRHGAIICVEHAIRLAETVDRYAGTEATCEWWYNMFFIRMSAAIIMIGKTLPDLVQHIGPTTIESGWQMCRDVLENKLPQNPLIINCRDTLTRIYDQVSVAAFSSSNNDRNVALELSGNPAFSVNGMDDVNFGTTDMFSFLDSGLLNMSTNEWNFGFNDFIGPVI